MSDREPDPTTGTARVRIVRCPECGSTDAACDESRSIVDISYMQCNACGYGEHCDSWQISFDWNVDIEMRDGELPDRVDPLSPDQRLFAKKD